MVSHSGLLLFGVLYHRVPNTAFAKGRLVKEHELNLAACRFLYAKKAGAAHAAVVKDHQSSVVDKAWKVVHFVVGDSAASTPQKHKAVLAADGARPLRDKFRRKVKVKVSSFQNKVPWPPFSKRSFISRPSCL